MSDIYLSGDSRYYAKREYGISDVRRDGSKYSPETDRQAAAAEKYAADIMGCKFNSNINQACGDGGSDFSFNLEVEVYCPINPLAQYLIVSMDEPHRWADLYVVVIGDIDSGFKIIGWTFHALLTQQPIKNFGYGDRYCMPFSKLYPIDRLLKLKKDRVSRVNHQLNRDVQARIGASSAPR